jgi:hypothetical protein
MPRERQRLVSNPHEAEGRSWRKEEVRPIGFVEGSEKQKSSSRQTVGSRRGRTSAQALWVEGLGVVRGVNRTRLKKSIVPSGAREKRCQRAEGPQAAEGCLPRKSQ